MKVKKIPLRTCVVTREKLPKQELLRVVRTPEGNVVVDDSGKMNGRGAYICNNVECLEKLKKSKRLNRVFEINISDEIYESLRGVILER